MEKIKCKLTVTETVTYSQEVELTQEEFGALEHIRWTDEGSDHYEIIESVIDRKETHDTNGEFTEISAKIVKEDE